MDQHALVVAIKEMALDLGRTPYRDEFCLKYSKREIDLIFGSYGALVRAAGLDPVVKNKRITNEIFKKDIEQHIEEYIPRPISDAQIKTSTLIIPDTHFPFHSQKTLDKIYEWAQKHKPGHVVQIGDLYDLYAHSKFPRSQNIYMPEQEEELGRKFAQEMWDTIKDICPGAKCVQIKGNHDLRPIKQTLANQPSIEHVVVKHLDMLMTFDGVELIKDHREEHLFEGVQYIHGYLTGIGKHLNGFVNTVHGHTHNGGTVFRPLLNPITKSIQVFWELDCGFAGDRESKVFGYTPVKTSKETNGFGWVDPDGPRFIPC